MEFGLKWVHMVRYGVILRLDGALWYTIISDPKMAHKNTKMIFFWRGALLLTSYM